MPSEFFPSVKVPVANVKGDTTRVPNEYTTVPTPTVVALVPFPSTTFTRSGGASNVQYTRVVIVSWSVPGFSDITTTLLVAFESRSLPVAVPAFNVSFPPSIMCYFPSLKGLYLFVVRACREFRLVVCWLSGYLRSFLGVPLRPGTRWMPLFPTVQVFHSLVMWYLFSHLSLRLFLLALCGTQLCLCSDWDVLLVHLPCRRRGEGCLSPRFPFHSSYEL